MNNKGASLGNMYPAVLTILLIGIVLGIGVYVLSETSDAISNTEITIVNESITLTNVTGSAVATATDCGASNFAITEVWNATTILLVPTNNYTFSTTGTLTPIAQSPFIDNTVLVSYTYDGTTDTSSTGYCEALETSGEGVGGFAAWIAVIVVVLAAAVVLGIVISSFGKESAV